jgi:hypothetical protein
MTQLQPQSLVPVSKGHPKAPSAFQAQVIYQRPAPQGDPLRSTAAKKLWAVYEYGTHVFYEFFLGGGSRRRETRDAAFEVMEAYKTRMPERLAESKAILVVDALEMERQPPLDDNGNEMWGAAIHRLAACRKKVQKFLTGKD